MKFEPAVNLSLPLGVLSCEAKNPENGSSICEMQDRCILPGCVRDDYRRAYLRLL